MTSNLPSRSSGTPTKIPVVASGTSINFARPFPSSGSLLGMAEINEQGSKKDEILLLADEAKENEAEEEAKADSSFEDPAAAQHIFGTSRQRVRRLNLSTDLSTLVTSSSASPPMPTSAASTTSSFSSGGSPTISYFALQQQQSLLSRTESLHRSLPPSVKPDTSSSSSSASSPTSSSRRASLDFECDLSADSFVLEPLGQEETEANRRKGIDFSSSEDGKEARLQRIGSKKGRWSLGSSGVGGEVKEKVEKPKRMSIARVRVTHNVESDSDLRRNPSPTSPSFPSLSSANESKKSSMASRPLLGRFKNSSSKKVSGPLVISEPTTPTSPIDYATLFPGTPSSIINNAAAAGYPFPSNTSQSVVPAISSGRIHTVESAHALFAASLPLISPSFSDYAPSMSSNSFVSSGSSSTDNRVPSSSSTRSDFESDTDSPSSPLATSPTASVSANIDSNSPTPPTATSSKTPAYQIRRHQHQQSPSFGLKELRDLKGAAAILESEARRVPISRKPDAIIAQSEKKLKRKPVPVSSDEELSGAEEDEVENGQRTIKASATIRGHRRSICDLDDPILLPSSNTVVPSSDSAITISSFLSNSLAAIHQAHARTSSSNTTSSSVTASSFSSTFSSSSSRPASPFSPFTPGFTFALPVNPPLLGPQPTSSSSSGLSPSFSSSMGDGEALSSSPSSASTAFFPSDTYSNDISSFWTSTPDPSSSHSPHSPRSPEQQQSASSLASVSYEDFYPSVAPSESSSTKSGGGGGGAGAGGYMGMKLGGKLARKFGQGRLGGFGSGGTRV